MASNVTTNRNMNWLIHELYTRKDFALCKKLIDRQLTINYDKEFLFYTKVRSTGLKSGNIDSHRFDEYVGNMSFFCFPYIMFVNV